MSSGRMHLPATNEGYGTKEYWDERYTTEETFDWFKTYAEISHLLEPLIPDKNARILMLGCGNSTLSADMYAAGFTNIDNIDYSPVVIARQSAAHPEMRWIEGDIRALPAEVEAGAYDVAIDKGTMDALMTTKGDVWDPPEEVIQACKEEVDEVVRILNDSGIFIYLTFGQPHFRKRHILRAGVWDVKVQEIGDAFHYYLYTAKKG